MTTMKTKTTKLVTIDIEHGPHNFHNVGPITLRVRIDRIGIYTGDIVRWGQKDYRGGNNKNEWGIVQADGSVRSCTPAEAKDHWNTTH